MLRAVDLSHVKAITNWDALCAFADIVIIKGTEGSPEGTSFVDPLFASRLAELRRRGKLIGVYHYVGSSFARRVYSAASEADWFTSHYAWRPGEVPIADYEPASPPADPDGWLAAWHQRVMGRLGCRVPMTYMNTSAAASNPWAKVRTLGTALWVARYFANNGQVPTQQPSPGPFGSYAMWQYTSNGAVPGVTGPVDVSQFYGTADAWRRIGGSAAPAPKPAPAPDPGGFLMALTDAQQTELYTKTVTLHTLFCGGPGVQVPPLSGVVGDNNKVTNLSNQILYGAAKLSELAASGVVGADLQPLADALAADLIAKLPAQPAAAGGLTRDDVIAAVREVFASAAATTAP